MTSYRETQNKIFKIAQNSMCASTCRYGARVKQGEFADNLFSLLLRMDRHDRIYVEDVEEIFTMLNPAIVADSMYAGKLGMLPTLKRWISKYNYEHNMTKIHLINNDFMYWDYN